MHKLIITYISTFLITFAGTAFLFNRMHARINQDDYIKNDMLDLIEANLLAKEEYETLRSLKKDQINQIVQKPYHNASEKELLNLSNSVITYYKYVGEAIPSNAQKWVFMWSPNRAISPPPK